MPNAPRRFNPGTIHAPLGLYSHGVAIPANAEWLFVSGQLGVRLDGSVGVTLYEQADQIFQNMQCILQAGGMTFENIVKLTTYMVHGEDGLQVRAAREKHLGALRPASTALYVSELVSPEWLVEIDAIAVKF